MNNLEKYVRQHREAFDDREPSSGHFERFEVRLDGAHNGSSRIGRPMILRIAAAILFLITLSAVVYDLKTNALRSGFGMAYSKTELPAEISEAIQYYDILAVKQLKEIDELAGTDQKARDLSLSARREVQSLDNNTVTLKKAFLESPGNERILAALARNQQMKEKVTSTILKQMNQNKKQ
ncbi:MAG: hypothetical protein WCO93_00990 [bacterium]